MPQKEITKIERLFQDNSPQTIKKNLGEDNIRIIEKKEKLRRLKLYHYIVHILAIFILLSYILFIAWGINIPKEFSTIVSIVIGFYFAKSLFNDSK